MFLIVGLAALRLRGQTGSSTWLISAAMLSTGFVLVLFAADTARNAPQTFTAMIVLVLLAVLLDFLWKRARARPQRPADEQQTTPGDRS